MLRERLKMFYEEPSETGGNGEGAGTEKGNEDNQGTGATLTLEELQKQFDDFRAEKEKETQSLKSQLGHANKQIETFQKQGKSTEELLKMEKEKIETELKEANNKLKVIGLEAIKAKLINEYKINEQFADFIKITPEMTEEDLKLLAKEVEGKQKSFKTELLKTYSITETGGGNKKKEETDFVDEWVKEAKEKETDLTKF